MRNYEPFDLERFKAGEPAYLGQHRYEYICEYDAGEEIRIACQRQGHAQKRKYELRSCNIEGRLGYHGDYLKMEQQPVSRYIVKGVNVWGRKIYSLRNFETREEASKWASKRYRHYEIIKVELD